jgi:YidC/Oxa1 family membrane protein insertase
MEATTRFRMDKKTIVIVVALFLLALFWPAILRTLYPPKPKPPEETVVATNETGQIAAVPAHEPHKEAEILPAMVEPEPPKPPAEEKIVTVENDFLRAHFTNIGGGIRSITLKKYNVNGGVPVELNRGAAFAVGALHGIRGANADDEFELAEHSWRTVRYRAHTPDGFTVTKTFTLGEDYRIEMAVSVAHSSDRAQIVPPQTLHIGTFSPLVAPTFYDQAGFDWYDGKKPQYIPVSWFEPSSFLFISTRGPRPLFEVSDRPVMWAAVKNQYFTIIVAPKETTPIAGVCAQPEKIPAPEYWKAKQPPHAVRGELKLPQATIQPREPFAAEFSMYVGPKEYSRIAALGKDQDHVMQFGMWGFISVILLKSMNWFYKIIPNYGIAIVLITFIVKILFWPIQAKSIKSMKQMQKFQPMMAKLREKYKDNPQKMNAELMKLYKEHKINPFSGCLPMLVQIPVFFAFFVMLRSAVELRGARFLWIKDLSQPDTVAQLAGFPLNPLPLVMGASMIWQMKLTPSTADPKQQQIMMFMPLMFLFICYNMSSGLVLYWTVQQFLSIAQQWWMMRDTSDTATPAPVKTK